MLAKGSFNMAFILKIFIAIFAAELVQADLLKLLQSATDIAGALGTKSSGSMPRGNGCVINWSYQGQVMGFQWKYLGVCTDSCTHLTETVIMKSQGGAVEHCLQNLLNKIAGKGEL